MASRTLRQARLEKLLSIRDLSARSGVSIKTIVDLEHGRQTPRVSTMRKLCHALGTSPREVTEFRDALDAAHSPFSSPSAEASPPPHPEDDPQ
jgi:transcriptional regulator with XRE-family HTH domain